MNRLERMKEIMKANPDFGKRVGYKMCVVDEFHDMKEQLEKEATAYALEWGDKTDGTYACCRDGYLAGAEPREKRITELLALIKAERKRQEECDDVHLRKISDLEEENADLKAYNEKLLNSDIEKHNKIVELKAQIEKMKCCFNCKHSRTEYEHCKTDKHEKWELKEEELENEND